MKIFFVIISLVIAINSSLFSYPGLCNHWYELEKAEDYPHYELVDQHVMDDIEAGKYKRKMYSYRKKDDYSNYITEKKIAYDEVLGEQPNIVIFKDKAGNELWTMKMFGKDFNRFFSESINGTTIVTEYRGGKTNLIWIDKSGNELNRYYLGEHRGALIRPYKNGDYWMVYSHFSDYDLDYITERNKNFPDQDKYFLLFFDENGNLLNQIELKYFAFREYFSYNEEVNRMFITCYDRKQSKAYSYMIKLNGEIIKGYEGITAGLGKFSEDGSYYLVNNQTDYIIDTETGEIVMSYKVNSVAAVSNKDSHILVIIDSSELMIVDVITKELLFSKRFCSKQYKYADLVYVEISGDGNDVNLIRDKEIYKFRLKDK